MWLIILGIASITLTKVINSIDNPQPSNIFEESSLIDLKVKRGKTYNFIMIMIQIGLCCIGIGVAFIYSPIAGGILSIYGLIILKSLRFNLPPGYLKFIKK